MESGRLTVIAGIDKITFNFFSIIVEQCAIFAEASYVKHNRTIIHVEVKDSHEHFYFGSVAAMYEDSRVKNLLKIKYQTFRTKRISEEKPFENEFVIVRKGNLNTIDHSRSI